MSARDLCVRTIAAQDESFDRVGKTIVAIAVSHEVCGSLYRRTGVAHGNAETASLEHRDVIAAVANDGDLRQWNSQQPRNLRQRDAFVGEWVGNIEIVRLRARHGGLIGKRGTHIALTLCENLEFFADANDLIGGIEALSEITYHCRLEPNGALLEPYIWSVGIAHQPILPTENPDLHIMRVEQTNGAPSGIRRQQMLGDDRQIARQYNSAIKATHRRRDSQRLEQHAQAANRSAADDCKFDTACMELCHRRLGARRQDLVVGD